MLGCAASGRVFPNPRCTAALFALLSALSSGCQESSRAPEPAGSPSATFTATPTATPTASTPPNLQAADAWLGVRKGGRDLGVVEMLAGKPWRLVLHSASEDARRSRSW